MDMDILRQWIRVAFEADGEAHSIGAHSFFRSPLSDIPVPSSTNLIPVAD